MVLIVAIGVFPRPFLAQIRPAVARLDQNVQAQRDQATKEQKAAIPDRQWTAPAKRGGGWLCEKQPRGQGQASRPLQRA